MGFLASGFEMSSYRRPMISFSPITLQVLQIADKHGAHPDHWTYSSLVRHAGAVYFILLMLASQTLSPG